MPQFVYISIMNLSNWHNGLSLSIYWYISPLVKGTSLNPIDATCTIFGSIHSDIYGKFGSTQHRVNSKESHRGVVEILSEGVYYPTRGWLIISMLHHHYRKYHYRDMTILRPSCLNKGISYIGNMTSSYWTGAQIMGLSVASSPMAGGYDS